MQDNKNLLKEMWHVGRHMVGHMSLKLAACAHWIVLAILTGLIVGAYSTLFAWILGKTTGYRSQYPWLLFYFRWEAY